MTEQPTDLYPPTLSDRRGPDKDADGRDGTLFSALDATSKETSMGNPSNDKGLDDIPDLAAYMNVQSPPTPPVMSELREEVVEDFQSVGMRSSLDPTTFFRAEGDAYQQSNKPMSFLTDQPYSGNPQGSLLLAGGPTFHGTYMPTEPMCRPVARKRAGAEMNTDVAGTAAAQKPEAKPKNKRRRRRNAATSAEGGAAENWIGSPNTANADSSHSLDGSHDGRPSSGKGDADAASSPVSKRRASGSVGVPSPSALTAQRNEQFIGRSPQVACNELNFVQNQSRVFVFSSKLANQAAESIKSGRHANIIEFHRSLPATSRLLSCLPSNQPSAVTCGAPVTDQWCPSGQCAINKDGEVLTPEQLRKRQENLAKLHGIGQLLNVYPAAGGLQDLRGSGQQFIRAPCSVGPRMYRFAGPPMPSGMAARRELMLEPNGPIDPSTMAHMTRCNGPYADPYMDCSGMLTTCPGTPRPICQPSSAAQLDWQRLQAEFYEKRAKEQQMGAAGMVRMPGNVPTSNLQPACQQSMAGRRMVLMKAGQPERFCSAVDFLRRTACPQNVFNAGCEMQMCPSPKQMNYEIDGQELIITKQLNSGRPRQDGQSTTNQLPSSGLSPTPSISSELAQPLSSMLQMTNSIPQPSTSPHVSSGQQSSSATIQNAGQRASTESRNVEATSPPVGQKSLTCPQPASLPEPKNSPLSKTSPCNTECRRVAAPYDVQHARNNVVMYKCQPPAKHYYTTDGNYYFDELGQPMDSSLLVPGAAGGCPTVAAMHNGPPSVNNTYVNATMSIQQLNIQSVQPPQGTHHPQQTMYGQQHALPAHHGQFQHQSAAYLPVGGGFDEMNQPPMHRPAMMSSPHAQVMLVRGQAPRIIGRTVRYDSGYAPQHVVMPTRPEYGPRMVTHHEMCGYPRLAVAKKPMMSGNVMMVPSEYCRDRVLMHHQSGPGPYNQMMMAAAMNSGPMESHHQRHQMISMMSVNSGLGGMEPSMVMYSSNNPSAAGMMESVAQPDDAVQRKAMETMDPVSARLAEAGMMFTGDPLELANNALGKQAPQHCPNSDFLIDGQLLGSPQRNPGGDRGSLVPHQPGMYSNACASSCKDDVL